MEFSCANRIAARSLLLGKPYAEVLHERSLADRLAGIHVGVPRAGRRDGDWPRAEAGFDANIARLHERRLHPAAQPVEDSPGGDAGRTGRFPGPRRVAPERSLAGGAARRLRRARNRHSGTARRSPAIRQPRANRSDILWNLLRTRRQEPVRQRLRIRGRTPVRFRQGLSFQSPANSDRRPD